MNAPLQLRIPVATFQACALALGQIEKMGVKRGATTMSASEVAAMATLLKALGYPSLRAPGSAETHRLAEQLAIFMDEHLEPAMQRLMNRGSPPSTHSSSQSQADAEAEVQRDKGDT